DVAQPTVEIAVIGPATELAVGRDLQSDPLLQRDSVLDRAILGGGELVAADFAAGGSSPHLEQAGGPQPASHVLGTERRSPRHRLPLASSRFSHHSRRGGRRGSATAGLPRNANAPGNVHAGAAAKRPSPDSSVRPGPNASSTCDSSGERAPKIST